MEEKIEYPYALTTLQRVKDLLVDIGGNTMNTANDAVLRREINAATEWLESETGRKFVQRQYVNEQYSGMGPRQRRIVLRQYPVCYYFIAGDCANGSNVITNCTSLTGVQVGMVIFSAGIIPQTSGKLATITAMDTDAKTLTLSVACGANQPQAPIEISGLSSFQYRGGTPVTAPTWTDFIPDQFELKDQGRAGIITVYGYIPRVYDNAIRASYWAGYIVDWQNAGDPSKHTLPNDLSRTCENLVIRRYKRRVQAGRGSEALGGATVSWSKELDIEDQAVIDRYRRVPIYF